MAIIIKNRDQYTEDLLNKAISNIERLQAEVMGGIKEALQTFVSIEYLYALRDHIDQLILDWEDDEIELEEDDDFDE